MNLGMDPWLFFLQQPAGCWRGQLDSCRAQPRIDSVGGTLLLQQKADIFG